MIIAMVLAVLLTGDAVTADEAAAEEEEAAGRLREAFRLYVSLLQGPPDPPPPDVDARVRERVVRLAARLDAPPDVPADARRFAVRAQVMFEEAQDAAGYAAAAAELRRAVRLAPWHAPLAFNLALIQEKQSRYDLALANIRVYLASAPADREQAEAKFYALEYKAEQFKERMKRYASGETPKDDGEAVALYREACDGGVAKGCGDLGWMYERGRGVPEDMARAIGYYQRGCQEGNALSCFWLGGSMERSDATAAAAAYDVACSEYGYACHYLGLTYEPLDRAKALGYFQRGCALGYKDACKKAHRLAR